MKNVLVTGGSRGIGAAIVRGFARRGERVGFVYKDSVALAQTILDNTGAIPLRADVSDKRALRDIITSFGPVDILIANAGIAHFSLFQDMTQSDWERLFAVNFFGAVNAVGAVLPGMLEKKSGSIVIMSSVFGLDGASCESAYASTKGALSALSLSLAAELEPSGIAVNCAAPGFVDTDMNARLTESERTDFLAHTPSGRAITPDEVAEIVIKIATDGLTGRIIRIE